jgi:hypothetical protein
MSLHWWHIGISYALTLGGFGALAIGAALRHRAAARRLAVLDRGAPAQRASGATGGAAGGVRRRSGEGA